MVGGDEMGLRGIRGERCLERRARREEMIGILLRATIRSGGMNTSREILPLGNQVGFLAWHFPPPRARKLEKIEGRKVAKMSRYLKKFLYKTIIYMCV